MKCKLFVCGLALMAAGCASESEHYAGSRECGYAYDFSVHPPSGLTPGEAGDPVPYRIETGSEMAKHPAPFMVSRTEYP
jgi:hypothetical protein